MNTIVYNGMGTTIYTPEVTVVYLWQQIGPWPECPSCGCCTLELRDDPEGVCVGHCEYDDPERDHCPACWGEHHGVCPELTPSGLA